MKSAMETLSGILSQKGFRELKDQLQQLHDPNAVYHILRKHLPEDIYGQAEVTAFTAQLFGGGATNDEINPLTEGFRLIHSNSGS